MHNTVYNPYNIMSLFNSIYLLVIRRTLRICENYFLKIYTQTTSDYIKILIGVTFKGDLYLDVNRC